MAIQIPNAASSRVPGVPSRERLLSARDLYEYLQRLTREVERISLALFDNDKIILGAINDRFVGETVTYDDLPPVPVIQAKQGSSAPTLATFMGNVEQYTFDATNDYVIGATEITHRWKEGTIIEPHIHWSNNGTDAGDTGVKWQLEFSYGTDLAAFSSMGTTTVDVTVPGGTADRTHFINSFDTTIDGSALKIGTYICWKLSRIASATAAPAANPFALAVGFHVQQDTIGSRSSYIK